MLAHADKKVKTLLGTPMVGSMKISKALKMVLTEKAFDEVMKSSHKDKSLKDMYKALKTPELRQEIFSNPIAKMKLKELFKQDQIAQGVVAAMGLTDHGELVFGDLENLECQEGKVDL
jgi:hypothetical protein